MTIFNAFFKVIRRNIGSLLIYLIVFVGVSMIITSELQKQGNTAFAETRTNIAVLNEDGSEPLAAGLVEYLGKNSTLVAVDDSDQAIQDAMFYGNISYAVRIPAGFSQSLLKSSDTVPLQKVAVSKLDTSISMDFLVQRYLRLARLHVQGQPDAPAGDIVAAVAKDLEQRADVKVNLYGSSQQTNNLSYYFRYLAYCILAIMILGISTFMMTLNDADLSNRNQCSPVRPLRFNLQLVLGNAAFALVVWAVCCVASFVVYGSAPLNMGTLLLCVNALVITLVALSIAFLVGKFVRDRGAQSAIANVMSLGLSFLSGVFVDQALLGESVLRVTRFEPVFWYVKAVDDIRNLTDFSLSSIQSVLGSMGIQLGFALAIFLVALALSKYIRPKREI